MAFDIQKMLADYNALQKEQEQKDFIKKTKKHLAIYEKNISIEDIELGDTVYNFVFNHHKLSAIMGPVGSGKSVGCIVKIFVDAQCAEKGNGGIRRTKYLVVRTTRVKLQSTTIKTFMQWLGKYGHYEKSKMTFHMKFNDVECEVVFLALDTEKDVDKLLSLECTGIYFNELDGILPEIWETALQRIGRYPSKHADGAGSYFDVEMAKMFGKVLDESKTEIDEDTGEKKYQMQCLMADTNAPRVGSYWQKLFEKELFDEKGKDINPKDFKLYRQPSGMAPNAENRKNLPENYYEDIIANNRPEIADTKVHVKYSLGEGGLGVFSYLFDREKHVKSNLYDKIFLDKESRNKKLLIGMDFGLNPACVIGQLIDNKFYVYEELYTRDSAKMGLQEFLTTRLIPVLETKYGRYNKNRQNILFVVDPAGDQSSQLSGTDLVHEIRSHGFSCKFQENNRIGPRLEAVKDLLLIREDGEPQIYFDKSCVWAIDGMTGNYYFKDGKYGLEDKPHKNEHSHLQDGIQYICKFISEPRYRMLTQIDNNNNNNYNKKNGSYGDRKAGY